MPRVHRSGYITVPTWLIGEGVLQVDVVYKFGGSSVADAERMREVAEIVCAFPDKMPCIVMSAMGKSTNLLLEAGRQAVDASAEGIPKVFALQQLQEQHREACHQLGVDAETIAQVDQILMELQQLLTGLSIMQVRFNSRCCLRNTPAPQQLDACSVPHVKSHARTN